MRTTSGQLDTAVRDLQRGAEQLIRLPIAQRQQLVENCIASVYDVRHEWFAAACEAKRIPTDAAAAAEEIIAGPVGVIRYLRRESEQN